MPRFDPNAIKCNAPLGLCWACATGAVEPQASHSRSRSGARWKVLSRHTPVRQQQPKHDTQQAAEQADDKMRNRTYFRICITKASRTNRLAPFLYARTIKPSFVKITPSMPQLVGPGRSWRAPALHDGSKY
jgi:hypothetical protein